MSYERVTCQALTRMFDHAGGGLSVSSSDQMFVGMRSLRTHRRASARTRRYGLKKLVSAESWELSAESRPLFWLHPPPNSSWVQLEPPQTCLNVVNRESTRLRCGGSLRATIRSEGSSTGSNLCPPLVFVLLPPAVMDFLRHTVCKYIIRPSVLSHTHAHHCVSLLV